MSIKLLDSINSPADVKKLSLSELERLAQEIRDFMLFHVSKTGGHLAPSLGVVELTLSLHQIFESPSDKIIWDVGHQSYVHKIITGRKQAFHTLRQYKGLSGFPKRTESVHDAFNTGHSSTSISAAVGMAKARDLQRKKHKVIAVIGDGALTGGMAFEALNYAGDLKTDLIVILNDNEMSIAPNVGAMTDYLSRIRTDPMYEKGKDEIEHLLNKVPKVGPRVLKTIERVKDSLKYLVVPGMLFEEMGFTYLGPIDGHNLSCLSTVLQNAKTIKGPVLVHVVTCKGKGYKPAEQNPDKFHGVGPFDIETGKVHKKEAPPSYTEVFSKTLNDLANQCDDVVAITAAMPAGTGLNKFANKFPERFFDVGIAEQHAVTFAAGLATQGFHPVVAIYSTFLQRAYDQILHDVCLQKLPVTFAIDRAGLVGDDGETHHGVFDISFLRNIPNLVIMSPKDENELRHMLATSINHQGPTVVRYPRGAGVGVNITENFINLPIGKGEVIREGKDVVIIAVGSMVQVAKEAASILQHHGIEVAIINPRFIKPLDADLLVDYAKRIGKVFTLEEHILAGGFGSACQELFNQHHLQVEVESMGLPDVFVEHGKPHLLKQQYGLTPQGVVEHVLARWPMDKKSPSLSVFMGRKS